MLSAQQLRQSHSNEITRLKQARDQALAAKGELQKEQKAEIERLKTQLAFRVRSPRPPRARAF